MNRDGTPPVSSPRRARGRRRR